MCFFFLPVSGISASIVYRMASQTSEFFPYESEMKEIVVLVRIFASFYILTASCTDEVFTKDAAVSGKGIELVPEFNENFLVEHAQFVSSPKFFISATYYFQCFFTHLVEQQKVVMTGYKIRNSWCTSSALA